MECNKDEAVRAKQLAESRMQRGEFVEALKFANKAKRLFADVENIAQILAVCEVHIAALNKLPSSEMDWYGILQTEKFSEETIVKKQYRKLALLLHPDKNKFAGAEAAFKLIGEANRVLSDQSSRSLYDMKVKFHVRTAVPKMSSHHSNVNVFAAAKHVPKAKKTRRKCSSNFPSLNPHQQAAQQTTFWTICIHCNSRFQFYINIINMNIRCTKCEKPFIAHSFSQPTTSPFASFGARQEAPMQCPPKPASESKGGKPHGGGFADTFVRSNPSCVETGATGVGKQHKAEKSKDDYVPMSKTMESQASKNVGSKRVRQPEPYFNERFNTGNNNDENNDVNVRENDADPSRLNVRRSSRQKQHVSYVYEDDDIDIPSKKPRQNESFNSDEVEEKNVSEETLRRSSKNEHSHAQRDKVLESDLDPRKLKEENCSPLNSNIPSSPEVVQCPDAEFNDFVKDKADEYFAVNQLWAIYDPTDAMPRFYALVKKVAFPFKLQISWLEPDPDEDAEVDWYNADLPIACGKFKLRGSQKTTDRDMFSHQIQSVKGNGKDSYLVFPKKGETWAIFRNWDVKWSTEPESYLKHELAYVEILSDFAENVGIVVAYLGKVKGFISLFENTEKNGENMFCILPNELYRFSHQIPSYKMSGDEREGVPRGCFELDPAALPTNFFEVGNVKMDSGMSNSGVEKVMVN